MTAPLHALNSAGWVGGQVGSAQGSTVTFHRFPVHQAVFVPPQLFG